MCKGELVHKPLQGWASEKKQYQWLWKADSKGQKSSKLNLNIYFPPGCLLRFSADVELPLAISKHHK